MSLASKNWCDAQDELIKLVENSLFELGIARGDSRCDAVIACVRELSYGWSLTQPKELAKETAVDLALVNEALTRIRPILLT
jgi:hypothetical protein